MVLVSVIWLNYNSKKIIRIVLRSLEAISSIEIPFQLVVVDNNSSDGSFEEIRNFLHNSDIRYLRLIRLRKNLGFTGGNNIGYLYSDRRSKYIALINNDLVIEPQSLEKLINFLERHPSVGAVQGVIFSMKPNTSVDTAGFLCSESLSCYAIKEVPEAPLEITFPSGAYVVIRRSIVEKMGRLFDWYGFMYFDDWPLGYRIWKLGYKVVSLPIPAGRHLGGGAGGLRSPRTTYYLYRGLALVVELSNSRLKWLVKTTILKSLPVLNSLRNPDILKAALRGLMDGFSLGARLRRRGEHLDIYSAPMLAPNVSELILPAPLMKYPKLIVKKLIQDDKRQSLFEFFKNN